MERSRSTPYCDEKTVPAVKDLQELISELHKVFEYDNVNVDYVRALLYQYKSNPKDWKCYAKFDRHRYTRNLVDEGNGKFNLMTLCWGEGHGSSIHSHENADCFVKVLDGVLTETRFAWPSEAEEGVERQMTTLKVTDYGKDGVAYICDEMGLHRMENRSHSDRTMTLHLYCPPFEQCDTFDEKTGHRNRVKMTFWSKYGERTPFAAGQGNACASQVEPENN